VADLFSDSLETRFNEFAPLAARMRPRTLDELVGQKHLLGPGSPLRVLVENDALISMILWGPPGSGKTSLASIVAAATKARYVELSAVSATVADVRRTIAEARDALGGTGRKTILFIDEIHRFNKAQQDVILPHVEDGTVTLIGSTTENPSFQVIPALRSRTTVYRLEPLSREEVGTIVDRALADDERGLGRLRLSLAPDARDHLVLSANGDARYALNALEAAARAAARGKDRVIDRPLVERVLQQAALKYDRMGDEHYDHASAFQKSLRGSDPDGALYWLAKMIAGGEDPRFIARRLLVTASEDVGNADPLALVVTEAAARAVETLGWPEARLPLAQAVIYVATAPKSNAVITAIDDALADVRDRGHAYPVPPALRDSHYADAAAYGHGLDYHYSHDDLDRPQSFLPEPLQDRRYYEPKSDRERERLARLPRGSPVKR
jgi:putative ATPase